MPPAQLDPLSRTPQVPRRRTRAQMIGLAAAQGLRGPQSAGLVRARDATVVRWRRRDRAAGPEGLQEAPRPGRPAQMTAASTAALVVAGHRHPRRLGLP